MAETVDSTAFDPNSWEDVCFAMLMETERVEDGFVDPTAQLIAKYIKLYPHFEVDLLDFAATCRTETAMLKKYPPPEPTQEELDSAVKRGMAVFRKALRNVRRREQRLRARGTAGGGDVV
jgi:hypothetical protein